MKRCTLIDIIMPEITNSIAATPAISKYVPVPCK